MPQPGAAVGDGEGTVTMVEDGGAAGVDGFGEEDDGLGDEDGFGGVGVGVGVGVLLVGGGGGRTVVVVSRVVVTVVDPPLVTVVVAVPDLRMLLQKSRASEVWPSNASRPQSLTSGLPR